MHRKRDRWICSPSWVTQESQLGLPTPKASSRSASFLGGRRQQYRQETRRASPGQGGRTKSAGGIAHDKCNLSSACLCLCCVPHIYGFVFKARKDHAHTLTSSITQVPNLTRLPLQQLHDLFALQHTSQEGFQPWFKLIGVIFQMIT